MGDEHPDESRTRPASTGAAPPKSRRGLALRIGGILVVAIGVATLLRLPASTQAPPATAPVDVDDGGRSDVEHLAPAGIEPVPHNGLALEDDSTPDQKKTSAFKIGSLELGEVELDSRFGGGRVQTRVSQLDNRARGMDFQPDGKLVVTGSVAMNFKTQCFITLRYNADGTVDESFGGIGEAESDLGVGLSWPYDVKVQPDGRILTAGFGDEADKSRKVGYTRYLPDGRNDDSFGQDGIITGDRGVIHALALLPDRSFLAAGYDTAGIMLVEKRLEDGSLDPHFGNDGRFLLKPGNKFDRLNAIVVLPDGRFLVAGSSYQPDGAHWAVARITPDGQLDASFGDHEGYTLTRLGDSPDEYDEAFGMAVQPDGKIVLAGNTFVGSSMDMGVARYDAEGHLDESFGDHGIRTIDYARGSDRARAVTVLPDGRIFISGNGEIGQKQMMAAVMFRSDGTTDQRFGVGGQVAIAVGEGDSYARAMTISKDGSALLGGFTHVGKAPTFALVSIDL